MTKICMNALNAYDFDNYLDIDDVDLYAENKAEKCLVMQDLINHNLSGKAKIMLSYILNNELTSKTSIKKFCKNRNWKRKDVISCFQELSNIIREI